MTPEPNQLICFGRPDFSASPWARLAQTEGVEAAWRAALGGAELDALAQVRGRFAVGLRRSDGSVRLAVDRFGSLPMCWRQTAQGVTFASQATELVQPDAALSAQALFSYLFFHAIPAPETVFSEVRRLPAAHCLSWCADQGLRVQRYWTPHFEEHERGSLPELRERFLSLIEEGVRAELDGSTPACFLSGGTDSSTVAGMLARMSKAAPKAYSIGFEAAGYDEMEYARIAARQFGVEHHEHYVTPDELLAHIPAVAAHYDQPFGNSSVLPAFICAHRARADGVSRLLAGDGGDELFGGNARYAKQKVFGWYQGVPGFLRSGLLEPLLLGSPFGRLPGARKAASYVEQARVPMPGRLNMYNLLLRLGVTEVLSADFLARIDTQGPARLQEIVWNEVTDAGELNRTLAFDWRFTLADSDLPKVVGSAGLAGLSVGFPLLSDDLLDFSLRLHPALKLRGLKLRWFFKNALRGFLPDAILTKSKHGFGLPFGVWAVQHAGLGALARESVRSLASRGFVRGDFVDTLLTHHLPAHPGYYGEMVWILMMAEQWLRAHAPHASWKA